MSTPTKKSRIPAWLVMANGGVRCLRCGGFERMPTPMPMKGFRPWGEFAGALHADCKDTGRVDEPPKSVEAWAASCDTGLSSMTIYAHMKNGGGVPVHYPHDPDDFGRCYRLLAIAPHWRARIGEMSAYGEVWAALAGAWDELTALYEAELPSGSAPKLYDRMKELGA